MKKTLLFLLISVIAVSTVFAATTNKPGTGITDAIGTSTELSFKLEEADIATYQIGFSSDKTADFSNTQPSDMPIIALKYDRELKVAKSVQAYLYYNVNATAMPKLYLTPGKGLKRSGLDGVISYKIIMDADDQEIASSGSPSAVELTSTTGGTYTTDSGKGYGFLGFTVVSTSPISANMADADNAYVDTITLTIASGL